MKTLLVCGVLAGVVASGMVSSSVEAAGPALPIAPTLNEDTSTIHTVHWRNRRHNQRYHKTRPYSYYYYTRPYYAYHGFGRSGHHHRCW